MVRKKNDNKTFLQHSPESRAPNITTIHTKFNWFLKHGPFQCPPLKLVSQGNGVFVRLCHLSSFTSMKNFGYNVCEKRQSGNCVLDKSCSITALLLSALSGEAINLFVIRLITIWTYLFFLKHKHFNCLATVFINEQCRRLHPLIYTLKGCWKRRVKDNEQK